jgi:hypothetical protein
VNYVSNGKVYVIEQNVDSSAEFANGQASYSINSTSFALTRDQAVNNTPIEGIVHSGNGTVVDRPGGNLYVIAGGVRWQFGSVAEYHSLGYSDSQIVYVSQTPLDGIYDASATHLPANETLLQGSDSTVWVMKSGQRFYFTSADQFNADGYSWSNIVRVPDSILSTIPNGGALP